MFTRASRTVVQALRLVRFLAAFRRDFLALGDEAARFGVPPVFAASAPKVEPIVRATSSSRVCFL